MANADDKRLEILDLLADHVLAHGLSASSLRPLAAAARTSDRMLLYYFRDKAELIGATLAHVALRLEHGLSGFDAAAPRPPARLLSEMYDLATSAALWPYMRLWLEIAALAARGDPVCRMVGGRIGRGFLSWIAARLKSPAARREAEAARLYATLEGMILLHGVGLGDISEMAR